MTIPNDIRMKSAVELAFVGDAVYELLVRDYIARRVDTNAGTLHRMAVEFVCAAAQSRALDGIADMLTDEERDIVRRGKNANKTPVPRSSSPKDYRSSTSLEALFGYLYLCGRSERINELFDAIVKIKEEDGKE